MNEPAPSLTATQAGDAGACADDWRILAEGPGWLVVHKPAGMPSVPGRDPSLPRSLAMRVQAVRPQARIVHRLDMDTSGLMVLAQDADHHRLLSIAFAERRVDKRYIACVHGRPADDEGRIDAALRCDWPNRPRQIIDPLQGKPSSTHWRLLDHDPVAQTSRLELHPITGRSHQLRVHLASIGHPIVGDRLYGDAALDGARSARRLMLHAQTLGWPALGLDAGPRLEAARHQDPTPF